MARAAIVLAGLPAPSLLAARKQLMEAGPNNYVVRGVAARVRPSGPLYDAPEVARVLDQAVDAVFGSTRRPMGFCRNAGRGCTLLRPKGHTCVKSETQQCDLMRPDYLLLLYGEGDQVERLTRAFHFAPLVAAIPRSLQGKQARTAEFCVRAVRDLLDLASTLKPRMSAGSPLLLPPRAFGKSGAVGSMLDRVAAGSDVSGEVRAFRQTYRDKESGCFAGRMGLGFKPGHLAGPHGGPGDIGEPTLALSRRYRLGCTYPEDFHWDVAPLDGSQLAGGYPFDCRATGVQRPKGKYANILVDDCLR